MSRPRLAITRNRQLNIGLTDSEYQGILRRASQAGMRPVDLARARLLGGEARAVATLGATSSDPHVLAALSRIGNNLNQIARQLNTLRMPTPPDLEPLLEELRGILRSRSQP